MQYDFSRNTFHPSRQYTRVLMGQGRVLLDSDWNEQQSILLYYMRTLAKDVFGSYGGAGPNPGFEILCDTQTGNLTIMPGRYYVDGILVENASQLSYSSQPSYDQGTLTIEEIRSSLTSTGAILVYLEVWERLITSIQDNAIREMALGGIETCARAKVSWRVVSTPQPPDDGRPRPTDSGGNPIEFNCDYVQTLPEVSFGTLRARATAGSSPPSACVISPDSHYRGAENQLYRVEIHRGGTASGDANAATFKFSRENGSVVFPVATLPTLGKEFVVTLDTLGRDRRLGLQSGDWVELVNDRTEEGGLPGPLFEIKEACGDTFEVTLKADLSSSSIASLYGRIAADGADGHPFLRRWDHRGDPAFAGARAVTAEAETKLGDGWLQLEDGIEIRFAPNLTYRTGDYWLIPARVETGTIEWPPDEKALDGTGMFAPPLRPHGPRYHYAPLLMIRSDGPTSHTFDDCRCSITRLPCVKPVPVSTAASTATTTAASSTNEVAPIKPRRRTPPKPP